MFRQNRRLGQGRSAPRQLFIHAGLHKTGTTALQCFLAESATAFYARGVLYPSCGIVRPVGAGHHNIAWQLAGDRRFARAHGTIDGLAAEIAAFDGDAVLSSEDFESSLHLPEVFTALSRHPLLLRHRVVVVIYVRDQTDYLESLYLELLAHGIGEEMSRFAEPLFGEKRLRVRDWVFAFDYAALHAAWRRRTDMDLVVRSYDALRGGSVIGDFCSLVCPSLEIPAESLQLRANARLPMGDVLRQFYALRAGRPILGREDDAIALLAARIEGRRAALSPAFRARVDVAFAGSNSRLRRRAGLWLGGMRGGSAGTENGVALERLFSFETQDLIAACPEAAGGWEAYVQRVAAFADALPP